MSLSAFGRPPEQLNLQAKDLQNEFSLWMKSLEDYFLLVGTTLKPEQKKALLLNCAGMEVRRLVEGLVIPAG